MNNNIVKNNNFLKYLIFFSEYNIEKLNKIKIKIYKKYRKENILYFHTIHSLFEDLFGF